MPAQVPWTYLQSPERWALQSNYWETFQNGDGKFRVDLAASAPQEVIACGFPRDERDPRNVVPMRIFHSQQTHAWYAAVYRSGTHVDEPLALQVTPGELQSWRIEIQVAGQRYLHRIPQLP